jgi:hypothetical protein
MAKHPNVGLVEKGFAAFAAGDMATLDAMFSDDIAWHSVGHSPFAGDFLGKQALFANWGRMAQDVAMKQDIHAILADDHHAVTLVDLTLSRGPKTATLQQIITFHIADGRVTEAWVSFFDPYAADEFWA